MMDAGIMDSMEYTLLDEKKADKLKSEFFERFEQYKSEGVCCSLEGGLEWLRMQGSVNAIIGSKVILTDANELADWIAREYDKLEEDVYCFDAGIIKDRSMAFLKPMTEPGMQCIYNSLLTDGFGKSYKGRRMYRRRLRFFSGSDYDVCIVCGDRFSEKAGHLHTGWCDDDKPDELSLWICDKCFCDLKPVFDWK